MSESRETTVLFVDVSDSTRLYELAGDAVAHAAIADCVNLLKATTVSHGGRVVKTIGDEVMAVFPSASAAADAAVQMQERVEALPPLAGCKMGVRIGLHHGPVVPRDGDVFGDTVNVAARLSGLATRGQIMTSRATVDWMTPAQQASTRRLYSVQLKGKDQEVQLHEILWQESAEQTTLASVRGTVRHRQTALRLRYLGRELLLDGARTSVTLGRDKAADLTVIDRMASRAHGRIECRLGKFVYIDHSANSTFITFDGQPEIVLRREELVLHGRGSIAFGQPSASATEIAEFTCE